MAQSQEDALGNSRTELGEQFSNYCIIVQYDDETVSYTGNNSLMTKALCQEALQMIEDQREAVEIVWEDEEEVEDESEDWSS
jgi:hypothetical protein